MAKYTHFGEFTRTVYWCVYMHKEHYWIGVAAGDKPIEEAVSIKSPKSSQDAW